MSQIPILPPIVGDASAGTATASNYDNSICLRWNLIASDLNRMTHSLGGPQNGPPLSARAFAIFHLAIHDAYFSVLPYTGSALPAFGTYLPTSVLPGVPSFTTSDRSEAAKEAVVGAAMTVLKKLYTSPTKLERNVAQRTLRTLTEFLDNTFGAYVSDNPGLNVQSPAFNFGSLVGMATLNELEIQANEPGTDQGLYKPPVGDYYFDNEPSNPIRPMLVDPNDPNPATGLKFPARVYHAPFYGDTAKRLATQHDHIIADPPVIPNGTKPIKNNFNEYQDSVEDVHRMGGAMDLASTLRRPDQTAAGLYWAYDGTNLIGTPPRHYNQILRHIAYTKTDLSATAGILNANNTAEHIRLFALANAAMADAGIYCWREKYHYQLWRPLSGVRKDPTGPVKYLPGDPDYPTTPIPPSTNPPDRDYPSGQSRPTWLTLGAPETNSDKIPFKPPFPSYPSGHATFGGAFFQSVRLFYRARDKLPFDIHSADNIDFSWVSDEMNGISRDLYDTYNPAQKIEDQLGLVRTRVPRTFKSCWEAMIENAMSRVWLGVHWRFDAFAAKDVLVGHGPPYETYTTDRSTRYQPFNAVKLTNSFKGSRADHAADGAIFPVGGVPLGIGIADDIWESGLKMAPECVQPEGVRYAAKLAAKGVTMVGAGAGGGGSGGSSGSGVVVGKEDM